jgi:hypothetical protein
MIKFLKKYWNDLVASLDEPLVLTKEVKSKSKPKKRKTFKKVKRLRIRN